MRFDQFTEEERRMFAEALWRRQRSFISGDRQFNDYGNLLEEVLESLKDYTPGRIV